MKRRRNPMKSIARILLAVIILGDAAITVSSPKAEAGRIGGPVSEAASVGAFDSTYFNIEFAAGEPAVVTVLRAGGTNLALIMYDVDGNVMQGGWNREPHYGTVQ